VGAVIPESIYLANWYKNTVGVSIATIFSLIAIFIGSYFLFTTYRRDAENQYRAHHDALTELPNRMLFSDRLQQALAVSKRNNTKLALLFLDLDNLKTINDTYGHNAGDFLLKELAYRMKASIRDIDTVGRIGGDEFIVLLPGVDSELSATKIAEKILKTISAPLYFDGNNISGGVSIGIVIYPDHGQNETDLINNADATMYEAKANGGNQVKIYGNDVLRSAAINLT
jgi:diguanylate cyclase (GGDEF)-like protein